MALVPDHPKLWSQPYRRRAIGVVLVVSFVAIEALAVAASLPEVVRHLGGVRLYGWAFSAFLLAQLAGIVITGNLVTRFATAKPLVVGVVVFVGGLVVCGAAPTMAVVVAGRAIQGIASGAMVVSVNVSVGRMFPPSLQPRLYAALSAAWILPGVVGPAAAGEVAATIGWRWVFLGIIPAVIAAALFASPSMFSSDRDFESSQAGPVEKEDNLGGVSLRAVGLAAGSALLLTAIGTTKPAEVAIFVPLGVAVGIPALIKVGKGSEPATRVAVALGGISAMSFFGVEAFVPLTITAVKHRSVVEAAPALTVAAFTWTAASWLQAKTAARSGLKVICSVAMIFLAVGTAVMSAVTFAWVPWWYAFVAWGIAGFGMGLGYPLVNLIVLDRTQQGSGREHLRGTRVAALNVWVTLGSAFGTGIGGAVLSWSVSHGHGDAPGIRLFDLFFSAVALAGFICSRWLPATERRN